MRISNAVNSLASVEPLESLAKPTCSETPLETSAPEDSQAAPGDSVLSSPKLPARPADDPLSKAFLLQRLDAAANSSSSALSTSMEGKVDGAVKTAPTVGGSVNDETPGDQESLLTARLAQELKNAGISLQPDDLRKLIDAITQGGQGATALAFMLTKSIAETEFQPSDTRPTTSGDPTQPPSDGNTVPSGSQLQISQKRIDQFMALLSSESDSSSQLSELFLNQLKKK